MAALDLVIVAPRVITPDGESARSVGVRDGSIVAVEPFDAGLRAARVVTLADDEVLLPGLVDTHVHVNDPGRASWEGFDSATRAAAAGGVTTLVDMPLNSIPPTTDMDALAVKRAAAAGRVHVDVGFWGGAVPGNLDRLPALHEQGVLGFKCFLAPSGVEEFPHLTGPQLAEALEVLAGLDALMVVHAEDAATIDRSPAPRGGSYPAFLASRPPTAEVAAVEEVVRLAQACGARVHLVHLSSAESLPALSAARRDGVRISAETCPHYLALCAEEITDGATQYKCCPPIRGTANRDRLWQALADDHISCVVTDHSPCTADLKRLDLGDFGLAWGGIASLQLGLPVVWTEARRRGVGLPDVVRWMAEAPARLVGLSRKGRIEVGQDADMCVLAPDATFVVEGARLHHRNPVTPYDGRRLHGVVRRTWLRGREVDGEHPGGRLLGRA